MPRPLQPSVHRAAVAVVSDREAAEVRLQNALWAWLRRNKPYLFEARNPNTTVDVVRTRIVIGTLSDRYGQDVELEVRRRWSVKDSCRATERTDDIYVGRVEDISDFITELFIDA